MKMYKYLVSYHFIDNDDKSGYGNDYIHGTKKIVYNIPEIKKLIEKQNNFKSIIILSIQFLHIYAEARK
jgi:hypothetical protein